MQVVLDRPMDAHRLGEGFCREWARGDVGASRGRDLVLLLDPGVDHCDRGDAWKAESARIRAAGFEPVDLLGDAANSALEPAVALVDILAGLDFALWGRLEIAFDLLMEGWLVVLHGQEVVGLGVEDVLRDARVAAHGIDGDERAFKRQAREQSRNGDDLVRLLLDRLLPKHEMAIGGEGRDQMQRAPSGGFVVAATRGLAIERDQARGLWPAFRHPGFETGGKQRR